jgi:ABC-type dipeptide/oligopeptide/nickel transport system permease subunit
MTRLMLVLLPAILFVLLVPYETRPRGVFLIIVAVLLWRKGWRLVRGQTTSSN